MWSAGRVIPESSMSSCDARLCLKGTVSLMVDCATGPGRVPWKNRFLICWRLAYVSLVYMRSFHSAASTALHKPTTVITITARSVVVRIDFSTIWGGMVSAGGSCSVVVGGDGRTAGTGRSLKLHCSHGIGVPFPCIEIVRFPKRGMLRASHCTWSTWMEWAE